MSARMQWPAMGVALLAVGALCAQEPSPLRHNPFDRPAFMVAAGATVGTDVPAEAVKLELRATLVANGVALANIDGEILAVGASHAGYRLIRVEEGRAVLRKGAERVVLDAYERQTSTATRSAR